MTHSHLLSKALFLDNGLYTKHPLGFASSHLSRLNPSVKFRDFQATNDTFGLFYYNGVVKSRIQRCVFPKGCKAVCCKTWPKEGQASLVGWLVLQGVTDCLIWGGKTLMSYMKRKEPLAGEMNVLFLLFNRLVLCQERHWLWFPLPSPAHHQIHSPAFLMVC